MTFELIQGGKRDTKPGETDTNWLEKLPEHCVFACYKPGSDGRRPMSSELEVYEILRITESRKTACLFTHVDGKPTMVYHMTDKFSEQYRFYDFVTFLPNDEERKAIENEIIRTD